MLNRKAGGRRCWSAPQECDQWCQGCERSGKDLSLNLDISLPPLVWVCGFNTVLVTIQQMLKCWNLVPPNQWTNRLLWKPQINFNAFEVWQYQLKICHLDLWGQKTDCFTCEHSLHIFFKNVLLIVLVLLYTDISSIGFENRTAKKLYTNFQKHQSNTFPIKQPPSLQQGKTERIHISQNYQIKSMHGVDGS